MFNINDKRRSNHMNDALASLLALMTKAHEVPGGPGDPSIVDDFEKWKRKFRTDKPKRRKRK